MSSAITPDEKQNPPSLTPRPLTMTVEQVKQIYDYTKFHIGLYSTVLTLLIAIVKFSRGKDDLLAISEQSQRLISQNQGVINNVICMLLIGGVAGALAASRIVYGPWEEKVFRIEDSWFWKKRPSEPKRWWKFRRWVSYADICLTIEHYAFWLALFYAIIAFK